MREATPVRPYGLEARELLVERGDAVLFDQLSFEAPPGSLTHIRGDNGSGKTTLLRTLAGLVEPDAGEVRWGGSVLHGVTTLTAALNYIGHRDGLCAELTASENLAFAAAVSACRTRGGIEDALARLGCASFGERQVRYLSAGQRQRVALARLVLFDAVIWMLDEPFTALDPTGRALVEALIDRHIEDDGIVLIATHQAFEIRGEVREITLRTAS